MQVQAQFPVWRCVDGTREDECTSLVQDNLTTNETFYSLVDEKMRLLADAISQRRPITDAGGIIQFINLTDIPIYKIIALNTRYGGEYCCNDGLRPVQRTDSSEICSCFLK
ncbi:hypothetical protein BANRA_04229 [Acinetobacter baumannii]|nr:hypothetical protein BANRA_04229 [Acinetobacter baumannii]